MIQIQANGPKVEIEVEGNLGEVITELAQASMGIIKTTSMKLCCDPNELMSIYMDMLLEINEQQPEVAFSEEST